KGRLCAALFCLLATLFGSATLSGLRLLAFRPLLAFDIFTGGLIDRLHREPDLAALVHTKQLHFHLVTFLDDIVNLVYAPRPELPDVQKAVLGAEEVHESTEVHDFHDGTFVDVADFRIGRDRLDPIDRRLDRLAIRRSDLHRTVVLDIDLRAGLFDDLADNFAASADDFADLIGRDLEHFDARGVLARFRTYSSKCLTDFTQDVHAAVLRLRERDLHDFLGDPCDLDVHLQGGLALLGAGILEVHVSKVVFVAKDVGQHGVAFVLENEAHGDAGGWPLQRYPRIHQRQRRAADRGH